MIDDTDPDVLELRRWDGETIATYPRPRRGVPDEADLPSAEEAEEAAWLDRADLLDYADEDRSAALDEGVPW